MITEQMKENQIRILYVAEILRKETDENHGLSMKEIIELLEEDGISAERKAIYRDINGLREFGYDIQLVRSKPAQYRLVNKDFVALDLLLMVDAVRLSKFLTSEKSESLVRSIKLLGSKYEMQDIGRGLYVSGRVKNLNQSAFLNVNIIQGAISRRRKLEFKYFDYGIDGKPVYRKEGRAYKETPVQLFYSDDNYYLVTYNDEHDSLLTFRVDRMAKVLISEEKSSKSDLISNFNPAEFETRIFGMFQGEEKTVTLVAESNLINAVFDRFGCIPLTKEDKEGKAVSFNVRVLESDVFFGWVSQFRGRMKIVRPKSAVDSYKKFLDELIAANFA